jgi:hypothetical protein
MSFAAPLFLWVAAGVSLVTVALHLLAWRRPPESPLPTARFAPEAPIRIASRAIRPSDLALLALRVVLVMLVGGALAGPSFVSRSPGVARVLVVDRSRGADANAAIADASRSLMRPGDALVVFDSTAREVANASPDSVRTSLVSGRGELSAALVAAIRAARRLERSHDSVEIVVVSPFGDDELDASTPAIRATWPGPVRSIRAGSVPNDSSVFARPEVRATGGDPVLAALALAGGLRGGARVRVARDSVTSADSVWTRRGGTLVAWPASDAPLAWPRRASADTALAVTLFGGGGSFADAATVVARFARRAAPPPGAVVARWADGEPAATESSLGSGCIRSVAVVVPMVGDLPLTSSFRRFASEIAAPCKRSATWRPAPDSVLANALPVSLASSVTEARLGERRGVIDEAASRLTAWLLAAALVAAGTELLLRRGGARAAA